MRKMLSMSERSKAQSRSLARSIFLWMIAVALVPLMILAGQGYHCARQAILDLESMQLKSVVEVMKGHLLAELQTAGGFTNDLAEILEHHTGRRRTTKAYLVSHDGRSIVAATVAPAPAQALRGIGALREDGKAALYEDFYGTPVLGIAEDIPEFGWHLVAEIDQAEAFRWLVILRRRAFATGLVTLAIVVLLAARSSRRVVAPMQKLAATAQRIAGGDWDQRLAELGGKEANEVAVAFNEMLDELAALQKRLVQTAALSAIGELSSSIVHEMRNPLSSVKMNLNALRRKVEDDPVHYELAGIACDQVARLEKMLTDLLQYGKRVELNIGDVSFGRLADDVKESCRAVAEAGRVEIVIEDRMAGSTFRADYEQMLRALSNLVVNGVQAVEAGGRVTIEGELSDDAVTLTVSDTGRGLPPERMERLFEPFYTTRGEGTGLGLAIVKKIAELHGGSVTARNREGEGAVFVVRLPAKEAGGRP